MKMTGSYQCFLRAALAAALLLLSSEISSVATAQDISGGAGEGVKRPSSTAPRRRPRTSQPKTTKRRTTASQPKVDLSKQVEAALDLGNTARDSTPPNYDAAERAYKLAMELDPEDARAHVGLGNTYFDQKRYAEAEAAFRRAVELDPEDADAMVALAYVNNALERYAEAERVATRSLALDRNNYAAHVALGWSHYRRKNYTEAESAYRRAIGLSPKTPELYSEFAQVLMEQGRWRDTEPVLHQAATLDPNDAVTQADYGVVLHKLGQLERAAEAYAQAARLDPQFSAPHSNLALVHYTRGDFARAREEWNTAIRLKSTYALDGAGLLVLDRKLAEAQIELEKYTQANGADEDGWLMLGDVRRMQGDDAGAGSAYARATQLAPDYTAHARPTIPAPPKPSPTPEVKTVAKETGSNNAAAVAVKQPAVQPSVAATETAQPKEPGLRYASSVRSVKPTNNARPTPASGVISITCDPNATLLIEPMAGGEAQMTTVPPSETVVAFNQLRPGEYRVVASLDGHKTLETRVFVAVNKIMSVRLKLQPKP